MTYSLVGYNHESSIQRTHEKYDKFYCINASVLHICVLHGHNDDDYYAKNARAASIPWFSCSHNIVISDPTNDLYV